MGWAASLAGQGKAEQGRVGQGRAGQGSAGWASLGNQLSDGTSHCHLAHTPTRTPTPAGQEVCFNSCPTGKVWPPQTTTARGEQSQQNRRTRAGSGSSSSSSSSCWSSEVVDGTRNRLGRPAPRTRTPWRYVACRQRGTATLKPDFSSRQLVEMSTPSRLSVRSVWQPNYWN